MPNIFQALFWYLFIVNLFFVFVQLLDELTDGERWLTVQDETLAVTVNKAGGEDEVRSSLRTLCKMEVELEGFKHIRLTPLQVSTTKQLQLPKICHAAKVKIS